MLAVVLLGAPPARKDVLAPEGELFSIEMRDLSTYLHFPW